MKRSTKALLVVGALIATPLIANHIIAKKAQRRISASPNTETYDWEYGKIKYSVRGRESAPPLLLVHGVYPGASNLEWEGAAALFTDTYRVYSLDLLGFGYSDKPYLDYSSYLYVRLIKDFVENVIGQPVVAAASLHGATSLISCAALNPEDFDKLLLISPVGLECGTPLAQEEDEYVKKAFSVPLAGTSFYNGLCSKRALPKLFKTESFADEAFMTDEMLDKIYLSAHSDATGGKYAVAALLSKFFNADVKDCLAKLTVPYTIILGEQFDTEARFKFYQGIDEEYPATTIEGAGILPHMVSPEIFVETVKDLL